MNDSCLGTTEDEPWEIVQKERRKHALTPKEESSFITENSSRSTKPTVVLKSTWKKRVYEIHTMDMQQAIKDAKLSATNAVTVRIHPGANTIAVTTTNRLLTNKLLSVKNIPMGVEGTPTEVTPYQA